MLITTIIIAIASLIATVANVYKMRWCFWVWLITNIFWTIYDFAIGAYAQGSLMAVYALLAVAGIIKWSERTVK